VTIAPERLLGIREVADLFGVDISTIRRWEQAGHVRSVRIGQRGHRRYHATEIEDLLESRSELAEQVEA
jgi:excisionase family DNA binding protein